VSGTAVVDERLISGKTSRVEGMRIEVFEESIDLVEYARIPVAFEVKRVLDVTGNGDEGSSLQNDLWRTPPTSRTTMRSLVRVQNSGRSVSISPIGDSLQPALEAKP